MNKFYFCGDLHGSYDVIKLEELFATHYNKLTKDDYVIVLGDFGFIWADEPDDQERKALAWFEKVPWTTLVVPGNHENWNRLRQFPLMEFHGARARKINDSVFLIERGEIFNIGERTFFAFGGGFSIDAWRRKPNISWWVDELPTNTECECAIKNLATVDYKVDYVLTHDMPDKVLPYFQFSKKKSNMLMYPNDYVDIQKFLNWVMENVEFREWHLGHYHIDERRDKFFIHYDVIEEGCFIE